MKLRGLRAVVLLEAPEVGGAEKQAILLARYLRDREGMEIEVWTVMPGGGALREHLCKADLSFRELDWTIPAGVPGRAAMIVRLARLFWQARIDVVLPFTTLPNMLAGLAFRLGGCRASVWNERVGASFVVASSAQRLAAALTPAFIANSRLGAECAVKVYGAPEDRVHVVWNGLSLAPAIEGRDAFRSRLGAGPETLVATMVANIHARKDHPTVLRAFQQAMAGRPPERGLLVFAGGAHEGTKDTLIALAGELGIDSRVLFPGHVPDVAGLLEASDLCVFASHAEGTPNGVIEAMAKGLPVVATDLPGIRDVLGEVGDRFLVPENDAGLFAVRLGELMNDAALRASVGRANRAHVEARFTTEAMGKASAAVIQSALRGWGPLRLPRPAAVPPRSYQP